LDTEQVIYTDKTLTAGAEQRLDVGQTLYRKYTYILMVIKNSLTPANSDKTNWQYIPIGENGTIDVEDASGTSKLGEGTAIRVEAFHENLVKDTGLPYLDNAYVINLTKIYTNRIWEQ
jgi:hypothetical protein